MTLDRAALERRERLAVALYGAWWRGVDDSRQSVGDKPPWANVTLLNRQRFYGWADSVLARLDGEPT